MSINKSQRLASLSVVMIVKNEADHLQACLQSVAGLADELVVVDSGSEDGTQYIAQESGAKLFVHTDWKGFGYQRQVADSYATGDYILVLDADERVSLRLAKSIEEVLSKPVNRRMPYALKRRDLLDGKALYPLGYGEKIVRLYSRLDFQYNDLEVHESVDFDRKKAPSLRGYLEHYFCDDLTNYKHKRERYALDWARAAHSEGKKTNMAVAFVKAGACFVKHYLFRGGLFSGKLGFSFAWQAAVYTWNKYRLLHRFHKRSLS